MAIYEEVLAWSERLPPWRSDALRRLCVQGDWIDQDLVEILDLAKQHHGVRSAFLPVLQPVLFAADHFPAEANRDPSRQKNVLGLLRRLDFGYV